MNNISSSGHVFGNNPLKANIVCIDNDGESKLNNNNISRSSLSSNSNMANGNIQTITNNNNNSSNNQLQNDDIEIMKQR